MTGAQMAKFLSELAQKTPLEQIEISVQQGEGDIKEISSMRVIQEMGEDDTRQEVVLRVKTLRRSGEKSTREEVGEQKKQAEGNAPVREPSKKPAPMPVTGVAA